MKSQRGSASAALQQRIPSRLSEAESLCLKVRDLLEANNLGEVCFAVELLARECLNNAVIHGNRNDADKSILLRLWMGRKWIRLEVSDDGPGFNWRMALEREADTTACSGRGLHLYALYAERVRFNRRGNRVTLWVGRKNRMRKETRNGTLRYRTPQSPGLGEVNGRFDRGHHSGSAGRTQGDVE